MARRKRKPAHVRPHTRPLHLEVLEDRRMLANVTVSNTNDVVNGTTTSIAALIATPGADGISLREAVLAANADNTGPADTIGFSVTGSIQLTNVGHVGEIVINNNLSINGPGASALTIRAFAGTAAVGDGARVFLVSDSTASIKDVSISGVSITGGDVTAGGAGLFSAENLTLTRCTISGNVANNQVGGGLFAGFGALVMNDCTISGNTANRGGGIYSIGAATITGTTISGNTATANGGGIMVSNPNVGAFTIRHSTITLNRADADNNATGDGGGIFNNSAAISLDHTIVAGNLRSLSTRDDISGAVVTASAYNLIGVSTGLTGISNGTNGNQIGTAGSPIDPLLGSLADNGGPTLTHRLLVGSPAIDMGDPGFIPPSDFDQRGAPYDRVADGDGAAGARIDIGAVERQSLVSSNFVVDTLADEDDENYTAGDLSLREAILLSEFNAGVETITFAPALTSGGPATISLTSLGQLVIADSVTIDGPGANLLTIKAFDPDVSGTNDGDGSRVFSIDDGSALTMLEIEIAGLRLTGGDVTTDGGGIFNAENLTLSNCIVNGNATAFNGGVGGGIFSTGSLTVVNSTISDNDSGDNGGGIVNNGGSLTVTNSTISGNTISGFGSFNNSVWGIVNNGGSLSVTNSTISGNGSYYGSGGGIANGGGSLSVTNSTISGNGSYEGSGIGISNNGGSMTVTNSTISGNGGPEGSSGISNSGSLGSAIVRHGTIMETVSSVGLGAGIILDHTIVAGNVSGTVFGIYSLTSIGTEFFGPLLDNGGPTKTHALLAGSPAIDAGDPNFNPADPDGDPLTDDAAPYDQRGAPFSRVADGNASAGARIDIGAYERQTLGPSFFIVDTLSDEIDGDFSAGDRSLREAVNLANGSIGAETISFAAALTSSGPATILLTKRELVIVESMTIQGPGENLLTIDASGSDPTPTVNNSDGSRIFTIFDGDSSAFGVRSDISISGLTLTGGDPASSLGGAILNLENLTITASTISGNAAMDRGGGIENYRNLTISGSTISGNYAGASGGGINIDSGFVVISDSTISGNSALANGGAIHSKAILTVTNSTISGNAANHSGGGIYQLDRYLTLRNSTLSANRADADASGFGEGGGVYMIFSTSIFDHTIVAGNLRQISTRDDTVGPVDAASAYNLIGVNTGLTGISNGTNGNLIGTGATPINPLLGPLADNGGPTMTHALLAGSPAINAGDPGFVGPPAYDQRGFNYNRVVGGRIDIGAFEFGAVSADFDEDGDVDGLDFLAWQIGYGTAAPNAVKGDGDADNDLDVDVADLAAWENAYGTSGEAPLVAAISNAAVDDDTPRAEGVLNGQLVDLAMMAEGSEAGDGGRPFGSELRVEEKAEFVEDDAMLQDARVRAITEFDVVPRAIATDFGDIAVSRARRYGRLACTLTTIGDPLL